MRGERWVRALSKVSSLPLLNLASPGANRIPNEEELRGYLAAQQLARDAARHVAALIQPGWTEKHAAGLINTYLRDSGVKNFFHGAFAWFGDRARFRGIKTYSDFGASDRTIRENEIFILDVAPIFHGYTCDIGYTSSLGPNEEWAKAKAFLQSLRHDIPKFVANGMAGDELWKNLDQRILKAGYDNIHKHYPFAVLGHRIHRVKEGALPIGVLNFGWQSYWSLLSRGLFGQLLSPQFQGDMTGLWAIEPHIGGNGFGAKFEEILVVEKGKARWLDKDGVL